MLVGVWLHIPIRAWTYSHVLPHERFERRPNNQTGLYIPVTRTAAPDATRRLHPEQQANGSLMIAGKDTPSAAHAHANGNCDSSFYLCFDYYEDTIARVICEQRSASAARSAVRCMPLLGVTALVRIVALPTGN